MIRKKCLSTIAICLTVVSVALVMRKMQSDWSKPRFDEITTTENLTFQLQSRAPVRTTGELSAQTGQAEIQLIGYEESLNPKERSLRSPSEQTVLTSFEKLLNEQANATRFVVPNELPSAQSPIRKSTIEGESKKSDWPTETFNRLPPIRRKSSDSDPTNGESDFGSQDFGVKFVSSVEPVPVLLPNISGPAVRRVSSQVDDSLPPKRDHFELPANQKARLSGGDSESNQFEGPENEFQIPRIALKTTPTGGLFASPSANQPKAFAGGGPTAALNSGDFLKASQPQLGDHFRDRTPQSDRRAHSVPPEVGDFRPDPIDPFLPFDPARQMYIYDGKRLNANRRPLLELGRPWYQLGQLAEPSTILGAHNPVSPQFVIFGDYRTAYASHKQDGDNVSQLAYELNLFWNLQLTGTERFTMFVAPLDNGVKNTSYFFDEDFFDEEFDFDVDFGYFEGDLGAIVGGFVGKTLPFDLPFAIGVMPLLVQNGVWLEDAFLGVAATIPARNSALFDISNMDVTFFAGFDEIISPAFDNEDDAAKMWGVLSFIEAMNGYWEIDYAFLEDRTDRDRSYHNIGIGFTRRYGRFLSNSTRAIINAGQSTDAGPNTADGVLLLSENSLITGIPSSIIPYLNFWAGFDRPQSAARAGAAGGVLRNTGILFESDGMTGFPTLDATAQNTFGGAIGLNIMPNDWSQQLVLEMAALGVMGDTADRNAQDDQYGVGCRYQLPLSNSLIFRSDAIYGFLRGDDDVHGVRAELRRKF